MIFLSLVVLLSFEIVVVFVIVFVVPVLPLSCLCIWLCHGPVSLPLSLYHSFPKFKNEPDADRASWSSIMFASILKIQTETKARTRCRHEIWQDKNPCQDKTCPSVSCIPRAAVWSSCCYIRARQLTRRQARRGKTRQVSSNDSTADPRISSGGRMRRPNQTQRQDRGRQRRRHRQRGLRLGLGYALEIELGSGSGLV